MNSTPPAQAALDAAEEIAVQLTGFYLHQLDEARQDGLLKILSRHMQKEREELTAAKAEIERLKSCLEPGTAPDIMNGLFREAERLGFYKPTGKHALTQFVEEVEKTRNQLTTTHNALKLTKDVILGSTYRDTKTDKALAAIEAVIGKETKDD